MHASPQRIPDQERSRISQLRPQASGNTLGPFMLRFLRLVRLAFWRAFQHDAFAIAKASAYSSILTFFPLLLVVGSVLATSRQTEAYLREISYALGRILPAGSVTAMAYLKGTSQRPVGVLVTASLITLWTASGVMISWMEGFRRCYQLPKIWGLFKERMIAFSLVILAGIPMTFATVLVAFGSRIETRILFHLGHEFGPFILLLWTTIRWLIATLTSIAVISLIYHNAVPRTQPWHSVLPGATLATAMWFVATALFGWYLQRYADYSIIYGSLGVAIALLVWMYMISLVVLVGAEFNAMLFPRSTLGRELSDTGIRAMR
jgi:membrane protein